MRHERALLTIAGLVAGLVGVIVSGRVWYRVTGHGFTGSELTDRASQALPLAAMAGVGLTLLVGRWGRRLTGLLVAALGVGLAVLAGSKHVPTTQQLQDAVGSELATGQATRAHLAALACGVVLAIVGVAFVVRAGRWRAPAARFERAGVPRDAPVATSLDAWKAMDAGGDPTADADDEPVAGAAHDAAVDAEGRGAGR